MEVSVMVQPAQKGEGCRHAELISYKVHRQQFKSLLVPAGFNSKVKGSKIHSSVASERTSAVGSDSEVSTEGEEDLSVPPATHPDKQVLCQSSDLLSTLTQANILVGEYIELKNCKRCGSMIFKDKSSSVKAKAEDFNADISPA